MVADSMIDINSIDFLTDEAIMVSYSPATEDCEDTLPNTNVVIGKQMVTVVQLAYCNFLAAFTTAQARLKLYEYMEELQERLCYTDTGKTSFVNLQYYDICVSDSIIPVTRSGDKYEVPIGCYLGEMTDEIEKDHGAGAKMLEYISTGSKSYGIRGIKANGDPFCEVKSKGFR